MNGTLKKYYNIFDTYIRYITNNFPLNYPV